MKFTKEKSVIDIVLHRNFCYQLRFLQKTRKIKLSITTLLSTMFSIENSVIQLLHIKLSYG